MSSASSSVGFRQKWIGRALIASLIINFLLIGMAVGVGMKAEENRRAPRGTSALLAEEIVRLAKRDDVPGITEMIAKQRKIWRIRREGLADRTQDIIDAVGADPFDADALRAVFDTQMDQRNAVRAQSYDIYIDALSKLTPAARAELAAALSAFSQEREAMRAERQNKK